jgi:hypothetical protein
MQTMEVSTWNGMTTLINSKQLSVQYSDLGDRYDIYAPESDALLWHIVLLQDGGPDVTDFQNNWKPTANAPLEIKAASGRPERIAPSPQPNNTIQRWSGARLPLTINGLTTIYNLFFDHPVYLAGGDYFGDNTNQDDRLTMYVTVPSQGLTVMLNVDNVSVPTDNNMPRKMIAPEAMLFPLGVNLTLIFVSSGISNTATNDYDLHVTVNYFEMDPRIVGYDTHFFASKVS